MKTTLKLKLLSGACLVIAASVQAQNYVNGDLLVGFTGGGNDFIYDIGQFSSLSVGQTWTLGPGLGTKFGVVGAQSTGKHIYSTSFDSTENGFDPTALYNTASANIRTISGQPTAIALNGSRSPSPGDTTSWTYQTDQPPGTSGNTFENNFFDPNVGVGSPAYFFDNPNTGGPISQNAWFTYNSANGTLSYVPEPTTACLFVGGSLLIFGLRRRGEHAA